MRFGIFISFIYKTQLVVPNVLKKYQNIPFSYLLLAKVIYNVIKSFPNSNH